MSTSESGQATKAEGVAEDRPYPNAFRGPPVGSPEWYAPKRRHSRPIQDAFEKRLGRKLRPGRGRTRYPHVPRWMDIPRTSPFDRLCAEQALSVRNRRYRASGDWHKDSTWRYACPFGGIPEIHRTSAARPSLRSLDELLGLERIADVRPAFEWMRHPAAGDTGPVWASLHERAALEAAWDHLHETGHLSTMGFPIRQMNRWGR